MTETLPPYLVHEPEPDFEGYYPDPQNDTYAEPDWVPPAEMYARYEQPTQPAGHRGHTFDPTLVRAELLEALDPHQRQAVEALTGPVLVVAGPGSGKTRVLTHRLAALIDAGVWPSKLIALTFTNKAAREMKSRLATLIGAEDADRATVSTFHSVCARILRYHHEAAGLPKAFTILDSDDSTRVVRAVCSRLGYVEGMPTQEATQVAKRFQSAISRAKNDARTAAQLKASPRPDDRHTGEVLAAYDAELARMGAVDFDDLLLRVLSLLQNHPDTAALLRARWAFMAVDEFQDTNAVQYEIVRHLVAEHRNVCVVGDADQSIYAFRGAQPAVVDTFTQDFPDAKVVILERNYRSSANICAVSRAIIETNPATFRAAQEPQAGQGERVQVTGYASDLDEARALVDQVAATGGPLTEHAVLVRTNSLTRAIEQELTRRRLSYDVVGTVRFLERAEVRDAISWLRAAVHRGDWIAFERAVSNPKRGVGPQTLDRIRTTAQDEDVDLVVATRAAGDGRTKQAQMLREFADHLDAIRDLVSTRGPAAGLTWILETAGVRAMVAERDRKEGTSRQENLDQLLEWATEYAEGADDPATATADFLEKLSLASSEDEGDTDTDRVQILTMHAAKGKEFDHVYVIGCENEVLPHSRALEEGTDAIAEERRLFFVAASRARHTLNISWCRQRYRFGKPVTAQESQFLDEIPHTLITRVDKSFTPTTPPARHAGGNTWANRHRPQGRQTGSWSGNRGSAARPGSPSAATNTATRSPAPAPIAFGTPRVQARPSTLDVDAVTVGSTVRHTKFGDGLVVSLDGAGAAVVQFAGGAKTLALAVAPLTLV